MNSLEKNLYVLMNFKRFGPLTRGDVEELVLDGRLNDDSLIRAMRGPWMRIGDFFAAAPIMPPRTRKRRSSKVIRLKARKAKIPTGKLAAPAPKSKSHAKPVSNESGIIYLEAQDEVKSLSKKQTLPKGKLVSQDSSDYAVRRSRKKQSPEKSGVLLFSDWHVLLGSLPSKKLTLEGVQALLDQRDITVRTLARHSSWPINDWRPIRSIPELHDFLQ